MTERPPSPPVVSYTSRAPRPSTAGCWRRCDDHSHGGSGKSAAPAREDFLYSFKEHTLLQAITVINEHVQSVFIELGQRLDTQREKYADIPQSSVDFLSSFWSLTRTPSLPRRQRTRSPPKEKGKAALTELLDVFVK